MHWTNIGLILVAGLDLGMALLIWLRNPKNKINISFALAIFFLAGWTFGTGMYREATDLESIRLWVRVLNFFGITLVIPFLFFTVYFPYQSFLLSLKTKIIIFFSWLILVFIFFIPNFYFIDDRFIINPPFNDNKFGHGYKIFIIYFLFYIFWAYYNLFYKYKNSHGYTRIQLGYIIIGTGIISFFGTIFGGISPIFINAKYFWLGPYFALPMIMFFIYFGFYYQRK